MIGVDYYPEHWDENPSKLERMDKDLSIMLENGIEMIRIGEFAWSLIEPEDGQFDFSFLDKVFEKAGKTTIKVMLCTPTATPPPWLIRKHPEILQKDAYGHTRHFGSRRHYCYNSPVYKRHVKRIVTKLAERYGQEENLFAWQLDNEFGCEDTTYCYCEDCDEAFRDYLEDQYGEIDRLNRTWGTVFWSQVYNEFSQIETPKSTNSFKNPHKLLDYRRFSTVSIESFSKLQSDIIRKHSQKPITHNFMVNFSEIDYKRLEAQYDFVSYDNYFPKTDYNPAYAAFNFDLMRSLQRKPFTVLEQQPGRVNWQERNMYRSAGWMEYVTQLGMEHGANNSVIFRFRALPFGAEQYHNGVLGYDGDPEKSKRLQVLSGLSKKKPVTDFSDVKTALYFDYEVGWMHEINGVCRDFSYFDALIDMYQPLFEKNEKVDIVFKDSDLSPYETIIIPYAIHLPEEMKEKLNRADAKVLITCMTDLKTANSHIVSERPLGIDLRGLTFEIPDFGAIYNKEFTFEGDRITGDMWFEEIELKKGVRQGKWEDSALSSGIPVIASEDEKTMYVGTVLSAEDWEKIYKRYGII